MQPVCATPKPKKTNENSGLAPDKFFQKTKKTYFCAVKNFL
jgi:hypothetical protein